MNLAHSARLSAHLSELIDQGYRSLSDPPKPRKKAPIRKQRRNNKVGPASLKPDMSRAICEEGRYSRIQPRMSY